MPAHFAIEYPHQATQSVALFEQRSYIVGRGDDCDIQLIHPSISRHHAHISFQNGHWLWRDLNSTNGCFIDAKPISKQVLSCPTDIYMAQLKTSFMPCTHQQLNDLQKRFYWQRKQVHKTLPQYTTNNQAIGLEAVLERAKQSIQNILGSDRVALIYLNDDDQISRCVGYPAWLEAEQFTGSSTLVKQALTQRQPIAINNAVTHHQLFKQRSVFTHQIKAAIACPILISDRVIAVLYADSQAQHYAFSASDIALINAFARQLGLQLSLAAIDESLFYMEKLIA